MDRQDVRISACVIAYNRAAILGTCLRALDFADEVIVVDKSSTDATARVARRFADRVVTVPWTPVVEDTRAFAVAQCRHDWVLLLDDDECLNPAATRFIRQELRAPRADVYALPLRHYILGVHDERAYYWPEHHVRLFRRQAVRFRTRVHGGIDLGEARPMAVPVESGACIHHLSHPDVASWIARTNRYTGMAERESAPDDGATLAAFAHRRIDAWAARGQSADGADYAAAVGLLRAVYDIIDRLKQWEAAQALGQPDAFARLCAELDAAHLAEGYGRPRSRWHRLVAALRTWVDMAGGGWRAGRAAAPGPVPALSGSTTAGSATAGP